MRRRWIRRFVAGLAVVGGACFSERSATAPAAGGDCRLPLGPGVAGSTIVVVQGFAFLPAEVHVKVGAAVTWLNCETPDKPAHTTTADQGAWSSPQLATGQVFTYTFAQPGTFPYHCEPHPFMTAKIVVE